ncbi:MAG: DUF2892 domain-containing protein [Gemmatimonadaceae bacterium]|nr:DUF2892 domain-containing protein [Gemmatimonadaceae bacterium]
MRMSSLLAPVAAALVAVALSAAPSAAQGIQSEQTSASVATPDAGGPRDAAVTVLRRREATGVALALPKADADGFASSGFSQFMASPAGRILRVVAGAGMIAGGIAADSNLGTGVAIAGAVPLLAGTFDVCVLSPLFGGPFRGKDIRAAKGS